MRISRKQLIAAAAAVLAVGGGVWLLHNRNKALEQRFNTIAETIKEKGKNNWSGNYHSCSNSDSDSLIQTNGHYIRLSSNFTGIRSDNSVSATKERRPIVKIFFPIRTSETFNAHDSGAVGASEVLSFLEDNANKLCSNTPNPSPNNNRSPVQLSGSVALRFFEQGGRIIG